MNKSLVSIKPLPVKALCDKIDPKIFDFETTAEIQELKEVIGQKRAQEAVHFGIGMKSHGYNLFAMGPTGIGKRGVIRALLEEIAKTKPIPSDWCYVYNFEDAQKPVAIELPPGWGSKLRRDMENLVDDLCNSVPIVFESEEYRSRIQKISEELNQQQEYILKKIGENAREEGLMIIPSPEGFTVLPVDEKGETISTEDFAKLSSSVRTLKENSISKFTQQLSDFLKKVPQLHKEHRRKEKAVRKEFALLAVGHFIDELKKIYEDFPTVIDYLNAIQQDVIINVRDFLKREESSASALTQNEKSLSRYEVNVMINNGNTNGAPVIYEENPNYANLFARIEHVAQFGTLVTDFTLIRSGALHKSNGGYLILDARKVLLHPFAWEGLKRALFTRKITIEPAEQMMGLLSAGSLDPEPIPLDVKILLYGERYIYYLLCEMDPDFEELFKVAVDFEETLERTEPGLKLYAQLIAAQTRNTTHQYPFDREAVAAVINRHMRLIEDSEKISIHLRSVHDLVHEADYWAEKEGHKIVQASDVAKAIKAQIHRLDRLKDQSLEYIKRNIIFIQTEGQVVGQVNGLSIIKQGSFSFGYPSRITAQVRAGKGHILDIQRAIKMGGPIHSKGVLIITAFLSSRYLTNEYFSLFASLVFEQTYNMVEGDSASCAEICALLSALSQTPINQALAITGSMNQHGEVQPIGGVNEKIEGYFAICKEKRLTGEQGVIIPAANLKHLMLDDEVVAAVKHKQFQIYAIKHIDEAIYLLTGMPAGIRGKTGKFPKESVNYLVEKTLQVFANINKRRLHDKETSHL